MYDHDQPQLMRRVSVYVFYHILPANTSGKNYYDRSGRTGSKAGAGSACFYHILSAITSGKANYYDRFDRTGSKAGAG